MADKSVVPLLLGPPLQVALNFALVRWGLSVKPLWRALAASATRVLVGIVLSTVVTYGLHQRPAMAVLIASPVAWAIVSRFDPRGGWRRLLLWLAVGTAVTVVFDWPYYDWALAGQFSQHTRFW